MENTTEIKTEIKTKNLTIKEFAAALGVDYLAASGVVNFFASTGAFKEAGNAPRPEGQRGKPSKLYSIPQSVVVDFWGDEDENILEVAPEVAPEIAPT